MDHEIERMRACEEAEKWFLTPYQDCQRVKGAGVDCAQYPAAVYCAASLISQVPHFPYSPQWHINQKEELYLQVVKSYSTELPGPAGAFPLWDDDLLGPRASGDDVVDALIASGGYAPLPGDFALYHVGNCWAHGAIVLDWPRIIHAVKGRGVVYGHGLDEPFHKMALRDRRPRFFSLFPAEAD